MKTIEIWENCVDPETSAAILSFMLSGEISRPMAREILDHFHNKHLKKVAVTKKIEPYLEDVKIIWKRL